ncbi:200_t:CDS:2, partial [Scutellospora calospora]
IATSDLLFNTSLSTTLYLPPLNNPLLFINLTMAATTDDIMNYLKANTIADKWQTTFYATQNTAGTPNW